MWTSVKPQSIGNSLDMRMFGGLSLHKWSFLYDVMLIFIFIILRIVLLFLLFILRVLLPIVLFSLRLVKWSLRGLLILKGWYDQTRYYFRKGTSLILPNQVLDPERLRLLYARDNEGFTCLHIAASYPDVHSIKTLVENGGAELLFAKDNSGYNALHVAASHGHTESAAALIKFGSTQLLTDKSYNGETALHLAASNGQTETALLLIRHGGSDLLLAQENDGWTCLHWCTAPRRFD